MLRRAFESQQQVVCDAVVKQLRGRIWLYFTLTPSDRSALGYVISTTSQQVTHLLVPPCDDITQLLQQISCKDFRKLETLIISDPMNDAGLQALSGVLKSCTGLQYADLKFQQLSPDGAKYVADRFKHLTSLKELNIQCSSTSSGGITTLFSGLQYLTSTRLSLIFECLDTSGASELASGLQLLTDILNIELNLSKTNRYTYRTAALDNAMHGRTNLTSQNLSNNNIGTDGAIALANGMHGLSNLRSLNLSNNNIGPDGATALAYAMHGLSILESLNLSNNNIGPDGAKALADVFQSISNLRTLDLSDNNIGPTGAISLAHGLVHLTKLRSLYLSENLIDLSSSSSVIIAMKNCENLAYLVLNDVYKGYLFDGDILVEGLVSPDDAVAVADLVAAAQHDTQDRELHLGFKSLKVPSKKSVVQDRVLYPGCKSLTDPSKPLNIPSKKSVVPKEETHCTLL